MITRNILIAELANSYQVKYPEEQKTVAQFITFIQQHEDCFKRSLTTGHITASALLLDASKSKALLMHHAKLNIWIQLGGHCDGNPDVIAVATKEAQEESGIRSITPVDTGIFDIDIHTIPARSNEPEHLHYDIRYLMHVTSDEQVIQNHESKELRWINKWESQLPTNVIRLFEKWRQQDIPADR